MPCSWLPSLPQNARSSVVLLTRPCTFVYSLALALAALVASAFFTLTHLSPPDCPCTATADDEPRTRPRPAHPSQPIPAPPKAPEPVSTLQHLLTALRPAARRPPPPPLRRLSGRSLGGTFLPHVLDEVMEARDEEEEAEGEGVYLLTRSSSPETYAPALTPDGGSDADSDGTSEVVTLEDEEGHLGQSMVNKGGKSKGLALFTTLRLRRTPSASKKASSTSPLVASPSPEEANGTTSPTASVHSASSSTLSSKCKKACPIKAKRQRAATTIPAASRPNLPSTLSTTLPRRQFSEPGLSSPDADHASTASTTSSSGSTTASSLFSTLSNSTSPTLPSLGESTSSPAASTASLNRKRSVSSLFLRPSFRSRSPLSRSPLTSPEPSPPPSPTLANPSLAAKPKPTRTRGRSPGPSSASPSSSAAVADQPRPPRLRSRVSAGPGADCSGASGLVLSDVVV
ncbi:hypothetical protein JCM11251_006243 [Rhodosporidiobolus azoricus]